MLLYQKKVLAVIDKNKVFVKQKLMKTEVITCPTYPSLLHTQTSFCPPSVGEAHVNCSPALVLRIGTEEMNSGVGCFSTLVANFCLASVNVSSHWVRFSGLENTTVIVWAPVLQKKKPWKERHIHSKTSSKLTVNLMSTPIDLIANHLTDGHSIAVEYPFANP